MSSEQPPAKRARAERWTENKFHNPAVPSYVPPEIFLHNNGRTLDVFLLRAHFEDVKRLTDANSCDAYFQRQAGFDPSPTFDGYGNRTNTPTALLNSLRDRLAGEMTQRSKEQKAGTAHPKEIVYKHWLTPKQVDQRTYGALIGARGSTHQKLEKEFNVRIVIEGRGISDSRKKLNLMAGGMSAATEAPHVRITAPDEVCLQRALERVEFILSDHVEAQAFREENRKNLAIFNGKYNPDTWVSSIQVPTGGDDGGKGGRGGGAGSGGENAELREALENIYGQL